MIKISIFLSTLFAFFFILNIVYITLLPLSSSTTIITTVSGGSSLFTTATSIHNQNQNNNILGKIMGGFIGKTETAKDLNTNFQTNNNVDTISTTSCTNNGDNLATFGGKKSVKKK